jgi:DNA polymerase
MNDRKEKAIKLRELREKAKNADLPLKKGSTNLVFGEGNADADVLLIGEGPGHWEDLKGRPFVGNAGALLDQLLAGIGIKREDVFITNVIMYRPPNNRDPEPSEIAAFSPYLDGIINVIEPKMIVTLGRYSMAKFLPGVFISSVHGKSAVIEWKGKKITIVPMYHPAAALRNGEVKTKLRNDFEKLPQILKDTEIKDDKMDGDGTQMDLI